VLPAADATPVTAASAATRPERIVAYHDSGQWARDTAEVIARARRFLDRHVQAARRPAVVLDVDDTSLSTYRCLRRVGFDRGKAECGSSTRLPAIPQTRALYRHARALGAVVFFVTGRRESARRSTRVNLHRRGYAGWERIVMRADGPRRRTNAEYKLRARRRIAALGYRIVVNVGDQASDLGGGGAQRGFKLPNPMYVTR
jgi:acid phosphatase